MFTTRIIDGAAVIYRETPGHPPRRFAPEEQLEAIVRALGEDPELTSHAAQIAASNREFGLHADMVIAVRSEREK